jgi:hypothetical protein
MVRLADFALTEFAVVLGVGVDAGRVGRVPV